MRHVHAADSALARVAFCSWMELNKGILFTRDYENTSSGYQNLNRG